MLYAFTELHPLLIVPLWLAAVGISFEMVKAAAGTSLGCALFGLKTPVPSAAPAGTFTPNLAPVEQVR